MTFEYGLGLGVLGCIVTFIGFFMAFLVINHNRKKELEKIERRKNKIQGSYYGDDTV